MKRRPQPANTHKPATSSSRITSQLAFVRSHASLSSEAMESSFLSLPTELRDVLAKVAVFVLVQALVYLILRSSSNLFSEDTGLRSLSFRPMRSMSVRRVLGHLSDVPVGTDEPSTSPSLASRSKAGHED